METTRRLVSAIMSSAIFCIIAAGAPTSQSTVPDLKILKSTQFVLVDWINDAGVPPTVLSLTASNPDDFTHIRNLRSLASKVTVSKAVRPDFLLLIHGGSRRIAEGEQFTPYYYSSKRGMIGRGTNWYSVPEDFRLWMTDLRGRISVTPVGTVLLPKVVKQEAVVLVSDVKPGLQVLHIKSALRHERWAVWRKIGSESDTDSAEDYSQQIGVTDTDTFTVKYRPGQRGMTVFYWVQNVPQDLAERPWSGPFSAVVH